MFLGNFSFFTILKTFKTVVFLSGFIPIEQGNTIAQLFLTVRVLQPTVHFELDRFWKPKILAKLKERFGSRTVRDVKFRIG